MMNNIEPTGVYATEEMCEAIASAFRIYSLPVMAGLLPGGEVYQPSESFQELATRFAEESGLEKGRYAVDPETKEFFRLKGKNDD